MAIVVASVARQSRLVIIGILSVGQALSCSTLHVLSGKGLGLQYLDSTIMESILSHMTSEGIPALPVHDSVICQAKHEGFLRQVMVEEYQKVMGFEPVIG